VNCGKVNPHYASSVQQLLTTKMKHKVVDGEKPQIYGWRIVDTLIRSAVKEGTHVKAAWHLTGFIQNFHKTHLNFFLITEELDGLGLGFE